jgi:hypothetical protein
MGEPNPSLTPEKRLLQLIEGGEAAPAQGKEAGKGKGAARQFSVKSLLQPAVLKGYAEIVRDWAQKWIAEHKGSFGLKQVNRLLKVLLVGFVVILLVSLVGDAIKMHKNLKSFATIEQRERAELPSSPIKTFGGEAFKAEETKNVFTPFTKKQAQTDEKTSASIALVDMIKDLKLAGISVDPNDPDRTFCMVEDIKKNITTFLKKGDSVSGMKIESIGSDVVTLSYNNEKIELR